MALKLEKTLFTRFLLTRWGRAVLFFGALTLIVDVPGRAASILFVGNSFTYGELSDVKHYRPETEIRA